MKRIVTALVVLWCAVAHAHVNNPDVYFEGDAGPYPLFVAIRTPQVIPGVATIEIRGDADLAQITVVPMRLTGPGSELPPTPDLADRSSTDPQLHTASLWLMEHGALQVRITVDGPRGHGVLAVPVPAYAQTTLAMPRALGIVLFGLMGLLALAIVAILIGALREAALEPGEQPKRRYRLALAIVSAAVVGLIVLGNMWWTAVADDYERMVFRPWRVEPHVSGCELTIPPVGGNLLPDHGHDMHLFLVRMPALDRLAHLHPVRDEGGGFSQQLPPLPAGRYKLYADIVLATGFPITGIADVELPELSACAAPTGDDSTWAGEHAARVVTIAPGVTATWDAPKLRANEPLRLAIHVKDGDHVAQLEPYMGMAAHAEIVRTDGAVFAHIHPNGSVAMPALELAQPGHAMAGMAMPDMPGMHADPGGIPGDLVFPYGFPTAGDYRVFVQWRLAGVVRTAAFDAHVE